MHIREDPATNPEGVLGRAVVQREAWVRQQSLPEPLPGLYPKAPARFGGPTCSEVEAEGKTLSPWWVTPGTKNRRDLMLLGGQVHET